ncbi:hypothetical protein NJB1907f44_43640 [Mycobacterium marinum]|nr:hypothetical protein NJB1808e29_41450 [Mycobacterium marinum]GJO11423.1 hypothetical protein NJB1907f34b_44990 [Mycobacterium marinum]GJO18391.1 hypothetical protein NJB1907E90_47600 [Mycobacterium marinum]GJO27342.1 hypothetical protein NJB1907E11_43840 [Mycobacterium marinum]GJO63040.1 hypothetical protein NJB1907f34a_06330 [Mycobacterium marinum]
MKPRGAFLGMSKIANAPMCIGVRGASIRANIWSSGLSSFTWPTLAISAASGSWLARSDYGLPEPPKWPSAGHAGRREVAVPWCRMSE